MSTQPVLSRRPLVIVIDPNETTRDLYGSWLWAHGIETMSAARGTVALRVLSRYTIDAVLTRVQTKDLRAQEFMSQLRASRRIPVPVIVLTETADAGSIATLHSAGASAVIPLLGNIDDLLRVLTACSAGRRPVAN